MTRGPAKMRVGITFGTFDLLHVGHINILERAKKVCDYLVVGVSTDALNIAKKGDPPVYSQDERLRIVGSLRVVDYVFFEESLDQKADYIRQFNADVLIMGQDWAGKFDHLRELCEVLYLPRTPHISTTQVKAEIFSSKRG
ncbi:MAG TPA: adenylyltransferase/cytidyltransferase family protein [Candidatus Limnocylindrales bacterium]|nr:adenylyltransferase/cytidyltransferase family protein [Candidatus Limnocylindrales bacterium]